MTPNPSIDPGVRIGHAHRRRTLWIFGGLLAFGIISCMVIELLPVELAGTTWKGTNERGEECEIFFGPENGSFTFISPSHRTTADMWWYYEEGNYFCFNSSGPFTGILRFHPFSCTLVSEDVRPYIEEIDLKEILGNAVHEDAIYCGGQSVTLSMDLEPNAKVARAQLKIWRRYYKKEVHLPLKPLPAGLGEAGYVLPPNVPGCLTELTFLRKNVIIGIPETNRIQTTRDANEQVLKTAYILGNAILNEAPGIYVVRMPKVFRRVR